MSEDKQQPRNPLAGIGEVLEKMEKVGWDDTFRFRCHSGLDCWTVCCRGANIFLTPYDVLRLKNRLNIRSGEFLEKHAAISEGADFGLPVIRLLMDGGGSCPFVGEAGCDVYSDRPTSCRLYPLGHGVSSGSGTRRGERIFFKIEEEHCHGWREPKEWRLEEWVIDQGAKEYNYYNDMAAALAFHPRLGEPGSLGEQKLGMILMALYDLDRFRQFVFGTTFLDRFEIDQETVERIEKDDEELLKFGLRWLEFSILGLPTIEIREK